MLIKILNKHFILKSLTVFISVVLCLCLILNAGIVQCFAVAGVDDALFLLLCAIMAACGVTFVSVEAAHCGADALWDNLGDGIQNFLEQKATKVTAGATGISILVSQYWSSIMDAIAVTFGDYTCIDVAFDVTSDYTLPLSVGSSISIPFIIGVGSSAKYTIANSSVTVIGNAVDYSKFPEYVQTAHKANTSKFLIIASLGGLFNVICNKYSATTTLTMGTSIPTFRLTDNGFTYYASHLLGYDIYFNGELLTYTSVGNGFTLTTPLGDNIVQDGYIINTNVPVSDSVCPDGIWDKAGFTDWLNDLAFGSGADVGNPSIDTSAYPNNDTWHDGSINDDIVVGSPSIGIAVPTSDEDVISLNPDIARDYENTTVKDKDIATDTDTDTDTSTDTDTDTDDTPSSIKPGGLPAMSLPEVLFKEKFPFCLPWDLYSLFVSLNATPKAPKFIIPFKNDRLGIDYEIIIDISDYEIFAKLSRASLSVVFVIALILLSRKLIGAE